MNHYTITLTVNTGKGKVITIVEEVSANNAADAVAVVIKSIVE